MSNSQSASASGIRGCSEELEKAFWQLWQQNRDYLYRCCLKWMGGNPTDAEEALSRAMLKAWDKLPDHAEKITNFRAWLTRLIHNLCIDIHRERRRKAMQMESIEEIAARDNSIAQQLAISLDNVYKRIQQARDILQKRLSRYFSGLGDSLFDSPQFNTARDTSPPTPLFVGEGCIAPAYLGGVKARCEQSDETRISDLTAAIATGCMNETINYHVTASCLETLHYGWYRSLSPLGWN